MSCAYSLMNTGVDVTLFEKSESPGGVIQSRRKNEYLIELGPSTLLLKDKRIERFIKDLGLIPLTAEPETKVRYILKNSKPVKLPMNIIDAVFSPLLSLSAKLRLFCEPIISEKSSPETVSDFFVRRLGDEVKDYLVDPFIAGTFAGNPARLGMNNTFPVLKKMEMDHGSLLKGFWKNRKSPNENKRKREIISFENGMHELPHVLTTQLGERLKLNSRIVEITRKNSHFDLEIDVENKIEKSSFDSVVLAMEAWSISKCSTTLVDQTYRNVLEKIDYPPVAVLHFGVRASQFKHSISGFGILIPEKEKRNILGILFNSQMFSGRSPEDSELLTVFMAGARQPQLVSQPDCLKEMAWNDVKSILRISGDPHYYQQNIWKKAIPQYNLGYEKLLEAIRNMEKDQPGLFFTGNYINGISIPDTILNGMECADKVRHFINS